MGRLSRVDWTETSWCWVVFLGDPGRWVELVVCSAQHWCRNPGNESHDGLGSLVVPCYGLSARYIPFWRAGSSCRLCRPRGRRPEMYTGWRTWWPAPVREALPLLPWVTCCVYCYLPGFGLWGIVDAQYVLNTSSTSLIISHACLRWTWLFGACWTALYVVGVSLFCEAGSAVSGLVTRQLWWPWFACLAAAWEAFGFVHCILDGATCGRCLIVLWGWERCPRIGYTAVMVAVVCMPGCGLGGIWICTLYFGRRYTW